MAHKKLTERQEADIFMALLGIILGIGVVLLIR